MSPGSPPTRRGERGRRSPPLVTWLFVVFLLLPLLGFPPSAIAQALRRGSCCPASSRLQLGWNGMARPGLQRPARRARRWGWAGAEPLPCCSASLHGRPRCYMCLPIFFFFNIGIFSFIVFFFFFPEQFFAASRIGWRRGGYFGAVLCGELHLLLHCRPKLGELVKPVLSNHFRGQVREEKQTLGREVASLIKARAGPSCGPCGREKVSGCLAEAGCGSGMCRAGCALPASSCGSGPAAPRVRKTCAVVCAETQGCFPAREQGAAAKEAPQPAPFATTREGLCSSFHTRLGPHRVRLCREQATNRPHKT